MTYTLELTEPSDRLSSGNGSVQGSCGTFLHRDRLTMLPGKLTRDSGGGEGCECIPRHASFMLDGVEELEPKEKPHSGPALIYSAQVRLDGGCEGELEIVLADEATDAGSSAPRSFVYSRSFRVDVYTVRACEAAGMPSDIRSCGDAWVADVYDAQGDLVPVPM